MSSAATRAPLSRVAPASLAPLGRGRRPHPPRASPDPLHLPGRGTGDSGSRTPTTLLRTRDPRPMPLTAPPASCQEGPSGRGSGQAADGPRPCGQPASSRPSSLCEN